MTKLVREVSASGRIHFYLSVLNVVSRGNQSISRRDNWIKGVTKPELILTDSSSLDFTDQPSGFGFRRDSSSPELAGQTFDLGTIDIKSLVNSETVEWGQAGSGHDLFIEDFVEAPNLIATETGFTDSPELILPPAYMALEGIDNLEELEFLDQHNEIHALLDRAVLKLRTLFKEQPFRAQVYHDPEGEMPDELAVYIQCEQKPEEVLPILDTFDDWWDDRATPLISFNIEYL